MRPPLERAKPQQSQKNPIIREEFYNQLNSLSSEQKNSKHLLLFIGDINAKISSVYPRFSESIGEFGKGISNSNCEHLLEYATQNDLVLTNTFNPIQNGSQNNLDIARRVEDHLSSNGSSRCNPYRNQIDYIICKNMDKILL